VYLVLKEERLLRRQAEVVSNAVDEVQRGCGHGVSGQIL
jgi:hypothetical protein